MNEPNDRYDDPDYEAEADLRARRKEDREADLPSHLVDLYRNPDHLEALVDAEFLVWFEDSYPLSSNGTLNELREAAFMNYAAIKSVWSQGFKTGIQVGKVAKQKKEIE